MKILNVIQGSDEWNAIRDEHPTASEASIMAGASKHTSRSEFIRILATGNKPEIGAFKQRIFDKGHEVEAAARPLAEAEIGAELYPVTALSDDGYLLASFDGVTLMEDVIWECKQWNETKAADVRAARMPEEDYWQTVQQRAVCRGARLLYTVTDGTSDKTVHLCLPPVTDAEVKALLAHWKQFEDDVANYQHVETKPAPVAAPVEGFGALVLNVEGRVLACNIDAFKAGASAFLERLPKPEELSTDQDFADAEAAVKACSEAESRIKAAKDAAMAQAASIDEVFRSVDHVADLIRTARLALDKNVKARKEAVRGEILQKAQAALAAHVASINQTLGRVRLPAVPADFAGAMKGKKTVATLQGAANDELARAKIDASQMADEIRVNLKTLDDLGAEHQFLFADLQAIVTKPADDFAALAKLRIAEHKEKEDAKLEQERQRIRQEEETRAAALAAEKTTPAPVQAVAAPSPAVATVAAPAPAQAVTLASEVTPRPMAYSDRPGCVTVAIGGSEWNLSVAEAETLRAHLGAAILTAKAAA